MSKLVANLCAGYLKRSDWTGSRDWMCRSITQLAFIIVTPSVHLSVIGQS